MAVSENDENDDEDDMVEFVFMDKNQEENYSKREKKISVFFYDLLFTKYDY
jgi:hypothetical protein